MAATYAILTGGASMGDAPAIMAKIGPAALSDLTAALLWTQTKTVYKYDTDFAQEIAESPLAGDIPAEILYRLPFYCVYIDTPIKVYGEEARGFFAWMEWDANNKMPELRLLYVMPDGYTASVPVVLTGGGIGASAQALTESALKRSLGVKDMNISGSLVSDTATKDEIAAAINLVLYVCSEGADIRPVSRQRAAPSGQIPKQCAAWDVGIRIGATLRKSQAQAVASAPQSETKQPRETPSTSPRPHIRRAHWHHFWTGPRDGERKLVLKWVHPTLVGSGDGDAPTVVLPVKD